MLILICLVLSASEISIIREQHQLKHSILTSWKKGRTSDKQVKAFKLKHKIPLVDFAKRDDVSLTDLIEKSCSYEIKQAASQALIDIRYEGYINKQHDSILKLKQWYSRVIPESLDFDAGFFVPPTS